MGLDFKPLTDALAPIRDAALLLPRVVRALDGILEGVEQMGAEVHKMRQGVDEMKVEVKEMARGVEPLDGRLEEVAARVGYLEPRIEDLNLALHPMRRATGKLGRRKVRTVEGAVIEVEDVESVDTQNGEAQIESGENVSQADGSPDS